MSAIVFPGQGSQRPGMGEDLYRNDTYARQVFDQVEAATHINVATLCFEANEETLRRTDNAQLALYTCGLAAFYALQGRVPQLRPAAMAGHSIGEYTALAAAGVISVEDGARLVQRRGELMRGAGQTRPGTMAAVLGLDREALQAALDEVADSGTVVIANDNCPGQLVISGDVDAVAQASAQATERGAKRVLPINVSGAFHSPLMADSAAQMAETLRPELFHASRVPVYSNVTAAPGEDWPRLLSRQLESSVRWTESVQAMVADGHTRFIECGAGEVLTGLLRRISKEATGLKVVDLASLEETANTLNAQP